MSLAPLVTKRLTIREYITSDLDAHHRLMAEAFDSTDTRDEVGQWLDWTILNYRQLAALYQPPYGDYAITLTSSGEQVGSVGLVPSGVPWGVLPDFRAPGESPHELVSAEFGLFWAVFKAHRGQSYAVEAAQAVIDFVFHTLHAPRIVATTARDNQASQRVMEKLGMKVYHNPGTTPFWFNVVGVLNHPAAPGVSV